MMLMTIKLMLMINQRIKMGLTSTLVRSSENANTYDDGVLFLNVKGVASTTNEGNSVQV